MESKVIFSFTNLVNDNKLLDFTISRSSKRSILYTSFSYIKPLPTKRESKNDELSISKKIKNDIIITSYISDEDLPVVYNLASLFLFPSLREGFGIPIIEAMAAGVPVITSNTSSMPEVAGESAHLINPTKTKELEQAIIQILSDEVYRLNLIRKGIEQSKSFSWAQSAESVLNVYEQFDNKNQKKK